MDAESIEGFREFARARFQPLRALAYVTCGDWQAAEDAVAGALSRLYLKWDKVGSPEAYARTAVIRAAIGEKRRPWHREHPVGEAFPEVAVPDRSGDVDEKLRMRAALRQVPPRQRAALVLRFLLRPSDPSIEQEHFTRTALAWKYDGTSWATFLPGSGREPLSRAESLAIAEALRPMTPEPVRAPYTFGWMRPGVRAIAAMQNPADIDDLVSRVTIDSNGPTGRELVHPAQFHPAGAEISVWHGKPKPGNAPARGQRVKCVDVNGFCTMVVNDEYHLEFQKIGQGLTMDDARHILRELKFTDPGDQKTWTPVA